MDEQEEACNKRHAHKGGGRGVLACGCGENTWNWSSTKNSREYNILTKVLLWMVTCQIWAMLGHAKFGPCKIWVVGAAV